MMEPQRWKIVLFDFDGVLCDSRSAAIDEVEHLRAVSPFTALPSPAETGDFGVLYRGILKDALLAHGLNPAQSREFFDAHAQRMRAISNNLTLFPGVTDGIAGFGQDQFAIITSSYSETVLRAFDQVGIRLPRRAVVGHEVRATKTAKINTVLHSHGFSAEEAVYVGDMESDILYCKAVPIRCIAVTYGYHPEAVLRPAGPLELCRDPRDMFATLKRGLTQ